MGNTEFTPGPWFLASETPTSGTRIEADSYDEFFIAEAYGPNERANARLISAAPDLLDALEAEIEHRDCEYDPLNPCWFNRPSDIPGRHWGGGKACRVCTARAAIAKAKGE